MTMAKSSRCAKPAGSVEITVAAMLAPVGRTSAAVWVSRWVSTPDDRVGFFAQHGGAAGGILGRLRGVVPDCGPPTPSIVRPESADSPQNARFHPLTVNHTQRYIRWSEICLGRSAQVNNTAIIMSGITPRIARRGIETSDRLGRHRWVIERSLAWLTGYRRLTLRYEPCARLFTAFLTLAATLTCYKKLST